jgi:hypothetical protein
MHPPPVSTEPRGEMGNGSSKQVVSDCTVTKFISHPSRLNHLQTDAGARWDQ